MIEYETQEPQYEETPEDRAWRMRRIAYYGAHLLLFALIVYRVGPNWFLFRSVFAPSPSDYVALTEELAPMVAAIKAYNRDTGKYPSGTYDLPKAYQPRNDSGHFGNMAGQPTITFQVGSHTVVEYDFRTVREGWFVYAPRYYGPIPAPIVEPAPKPTTIPTTTSTTHDTN